MSTHRFIFKFKNYYRVLFKTPSLINLYILYLALVILLIMLKLDVLKYLVFHLSTVLTYTIYARFSNTVFRKFSRLFALSVITTVYAVVFDRLFVGNVGLLSSIALQIVPLIGLDGFSLIRAAIPLIPVYATLLLTQCCIFKTTAYALVAWLILVAVDYAILLYVSRQRVNGFTSIELGTLFLRNRLLGDRRIEEVFSKLGTSVKVNPCLFISGSTAIIYTDVHYGPWGDVGSGSLPSILVSKLGDLGYNVFVLHGAGSHERNIATYEHSYNFVNRVASLINNPTYFTEEKIHGVFSLRGGDMWELAGLVFDKTLILFVSRVGGGIDDLPYDIQVFSKDVFKGVCERCIVVDSHNWELEDQPNFAELRKLIESSLDLVKELKKRGPCEVQTRSTCAETHGSAGVAHLCVLEFSSKCLDKPFILLYLRGNNMVKGLRDKLRNVVKETYGSDIYVEVLTNDEHTYTGVHAFQLYTPIHEGRELFETVREAVRRLRRLNYNTGLKSACSENEVVVFGEAAYKLAELLDKTFMKTSFLLLSYVFTAPFLTNIVFNAILKYLM